MSALAQLENLGARLRPSGFDVCVPFRVQALASELARAGSPWPGTGDFPRGRLGPPLESGLLVANGRALWPAFRAHLKETTTPGPNPLDAYVERCVRAAIRDIEGAEVLFSHGPAGGKLPIQRIAHATGQLPLGPAHLNVHPRLGPWLALRAVILLPGELNESDLKLPLSAHPCQGCEAPCRQALDAALSGVLTPNAASLTSPALSDRARSFLAVREVCPLGQDERYTDDQVAFHYAALG